jgi:hypothetical protein
MNQADFSLPEGWKAAVTVTDYSDRSGRLVVIDENGELQSTDIEIGLVDALKNGNYNYIDREAAEDRRAAMLQAYDADFFLASSNAITDDGVLDNIDGNANRVSAIAYGPKKVLMIVGMNKVCSDVDSAMKRARNVAAPINNQRFNGNNPCTKTGACANCKSPDTICCQFLVTRYSRHQDRIHVILVNEPLGF